MTGEARSAVVVAVYINIAIATAIATAVAVAVAVILRGAKRSRRIHPGEAAWQPWILRLRAG